MNKKGADTKSSSQHHHHSELIETKSGGATKPNQVRINCSFIKS